MVPRSSSCGMPPPSQQKGAGYAFLLISIVNIILLVTTTGAGIAFTSITDRLLPGPLDLPWTPKSYGIRRAIRITISILVPILVSIPMCIILLFGLIISSPFSQAVTIAAWLPTFCPGNTAISTFDCPRFPNVPCYRESLPQFLADINGIEHDIFLIILFAWVAVVASLFCTLAGVTLSILVTNK